MKIPCDVSPISFHDGTSSSTTKSQQQPKNPKVPLSKYNKKWMFWKSLLFHDSSVEVLLCVHKKGLDVYRTHDKEFFLCATFCVAPHSYIIGAHKATENASLHILVQHQDPHLGVSIETFHKIYFGMDPQKNPLTATTTASKVVPLTSLSSSSPAVSRSIPPPSLTAKTRPRTFFERKNHQKKMSHSHSTSSGLYTQTTATTTTTTDGTSSQKPPVFVQTWKESPHSKKNEQLGSFHLFGDVSYKFPCRIQSFDDRFVLTENLDIAPIPDDHTHYPTICKSFISTPIRVSDDIEDFEDSVEQRAYFYKTLQRLSRESKQQQKSTKPPPLPSISFRLHSDGNLLFLQVGGSRSHFDTVMDDYDDVDHEGDDDDDDDEHPHTCRYLCIALMEDLDRQIEFHLVIDPIFDMDRLNISSSGSSCISLLSPRGGALCIPPTRVIACPPTPRSPNGSVSKPYHNIKIPEKTQEDYTPPSNELDLEIPCSLDSDPSCTPRRVVRRSFHEIFPCFSDTKFLFSRGTRRVGSIDTKGNLRIFATINTNGWTLKQLATESLWFPPVMTDSPSRMNNTTAPPVVQQNIHHQNPHLMPTPKRSSINLHEARDTILSKRFSASTPVQQQQQQKPRGGDLSPRWNSHVRGSKLSSVNRISLGRHHGTEEESPPQCASRSIQIVDIPVDLANLTAICLGKKFTYIYNMDSLELVFQTNQFNLYRENRGGHHWHTTTNQASPSIYEEFIPKENVTPLVWSESQSRLLFACTPRYLLSLDFLEAYTSHPLVFFYRNAYIIDRDERQPIRLNLPYMQLMAHARLRHQQTTSHLFPSSRMSRQMILHRHFNRGAPFGVESLPVVSSSSSLMGGVPSSIFRKTVRSVLPYVSRAVPKTPFDLLEKLYTSDLVDFDFNSRFFVMITGFSSERQCSTLNLYQPFLLEKIWDSTSPHILSRAFDDPLVAVRLIQETALVVVHKNSRVDIFQIITSKNAHLYLRHSFCIYEEKNIDARVNQCYLTLLGGFEEQQQNLSNNLSDEVFVLVSHDHDDDDEHSLENDDDDLEPLSILEKPSDDKGILVIGSELNIYNKMDGRPCYFNSNNNHGRKVYQSKIVRVDFPNLTAQTIAAHQLDLFPSSPKSTFSSIVACGASKRTSSVWSVHQFPEHKFMARFQNLEQRRYLDGHQKVYYEYDIKVDPQFVPLEWDLTLRVATGIFQPFHDHFYNESLRVLNDQSSSSSPFLQSSSVASKKCMHFFHQELDALFRTCQIKGWPQYCHCPNRMAVRRTINDREFTMDEDHYDCICGTTTSDCSENHHMGKDYDHTQDQDQDEDEGEEMFIQEKYTGRVCGFLFESLLKELGHLSRNGTTLENGKRNTPGDPKFLHCCDACGRTWKEIVHFELAQFLLHVDRSLFINGPNTLWVDQLIDEIVGHMDSYAFLIKCTKMYDGDIFKDSLKRNECMLLKTVMAQLLDCQDLANVMDLLHIYIELRVEDHPCSVWDLFGAIYDLFFKESSQRSTVPMIYRQFVDYALKIQQECNLDMLPFLSDTCSDDLSWFI